jgi:hypothetical protein
MTERLGRDFEHRLVSFPPRTVSVLWRATESVDYILCEENTSPWHQVLITAMSYGI